MKRPLQKKILRWTTGCLAGVLLFCLFCNLWVVMSTRAYVYNNPEHIPANSVGLVLGTSPWYRSGHENPFFKHRIEAAVDLYRRGKVRHLIVSGDNATIYYNEPVYMLNALLQAGVPREAITLDYAGFRTLDSVVRCKEVFGQDSVTIISQSFHDFRALFIGKHYLKDPIAYAAPAPAEASPRTAVREMFARALAVLDLYVFHQQPRFLGKPEKLPV
ncbi:SanA protein [Catalinimonas alkaloidigena]|uniref:SanA protein n=1 Tax=Catalinimonas alkaloidigena TaxID=1075417 RepID=A0A1G9S4V3_9BACT|nr:ElyC/SanA/YdcF family protein [Catalinimonas alkaloidigena]SDM30533.1 SanA protein [Catalinimonas alkaloidigena]